MNGERIKIARKKAGLSLRGLADRMDGVVSAQAIGKYERGEMSPGSAVLLALCKALDVSLYYLNAPQAVELGAVEFRTRSNTTAKERARVETEVIEWIERYLQIEAILEIESGVWACPEGMPRRIESIEEAEALADDLRDAWELGTDPIPNMTELLELQGLKVLHAALPANVSGLTCLVKRGAGQADIPVIVVNRTHNLERRRFTLAHELAHRVIDGSGIADIEKLCHRFAGSFLIHRAHLLDEIGPKRSAVSVQEVLNLKQIYRVSAASFLVRLEQVGVLNQAALRYAFQSYARTWRKEEPQPLEQPGETEKRDEPKRFERLVYRAAIEDLISLPKAVELLRRPLHEVEEGLRGPARADADHRHR